MNKEEFRERVRKYLDEDHRDIEFKNKFEENELDYVISMIKEKNLNLTQDELAYCSLVKLKFGNQLVYASMLMYDILYHLTGDEGYKKLWAEFTDAVEGVSEDN